MNRSVLKRRIFLIDYDLFKLLVEMIYDARVSTNSTVIRALLLQTERSALDHSLHVDFTRGLMG